MSINEIIVYLMVVFMALGAVDRILGNRFGLGEKFEEGIPCVRPGFRRRAIWCAAS